jgi:hypothetical protein
VRFLRKSALLMFSASILICADPAVLHAQGNATARSTAAPKNRIQVETRADGLGTVVPAQNLSSGSPITVYAIERDPVNKFVGNVAATWTLTGITGGVVQGDLVSSGDRKSAVLTGHVRGTAVVQASSGTLTAVPSGTITVISGPAVQVRVETAANGTGTVISTQNLQSGRTLTGYAVSRDASLNFVANVAAVWSLMAATGGVVPADLIASADTRSAVFTGHRIGSAQVRPTSGTLAAIPSGTITVTPGSATQIRVETAADGSGVVVPSRTLQTGKTLTAFAVARDASQNFVANIAATGPRDVLITNKPPGGGTTTLAGTFTVEKNTYPATITLNGQVEFPSKAKPSDYTASDYRLVGIPGGSGWGMRDILSGAHGTDWEAYWDNGQSSDYLVPFDDGPDFRLTAGRAFWLVRRGGVTFQGIVPSTPLDSGAVGIPIHSGWNLITNPMVRNTPWSETQSANGGFTEMLFGFNGAFFSSADLRPYAGYYFFNSTERQTLRVPYFPSQFRLPRSGVDTGAWR